jgi:hypothetical protein
MTHSIQKRYGIYVTTLADFEYPPVRIVRFSGPAFTEGVEEHVVGGVND